MKTGLLPGILIVLAVAQIPPVDAQPDRASFVIAPFMQRAYQAEAAGNWQEVRRQSEQALTRANQHVEARQLLVRALLALERFSDAETQSLLLPEALQHSALVNVRQQWLDRSLPSPSDFSRWYTEVDEQQWLEWVSVSAYQREQRTGPEASTAFLQNLLQLINDWRVARLLIIYATGDGNLAEKKDALLLLLRSGELNDVEAERLGQVLASLGDTEEARGLLAGYADEPWRRAMLDGLLGRLIFLTQYPLAKEIILTEWSLGNMPERIRGQLLELAILTEDATLMAQPALRPATQCLDSVAWLGDRDTTLAGELLRECDRSLDEPRWLYLASLYAPTLLPPQNSSVLTETQLKAQAEREAAFLRAQEIQRLAQRRQDTLDAAYQGECVLPADPLLDVIRDEVNAICLSRHLPGAASVYYERVLQDESNPRYQQLLRDAAYNAYQAGDYDLGISYWQQASKPLTVSEQEALTATIAAKEVAEQREAPHGDGVTMSIDALRAAAMEMPDLYGLELGLRLSGNKRQAERESAIPWLKAAAQRDPYDFRIPETLAYRYHERGEPGAAMLNAQRAIDSMDTALAAGDATAQQLLEREFSLRRTHQFLAQRNRLYVGAAWSQFGAPTAISAIGTKSSDSTFQIVSLEHLLGDYPTVAGRQLGVYARALGSSNDNSQYFDNPAWGIGLRWKPLGNHNLNLFTEVFEPNAGRTDLMLRASASMLDEGDLRDDWRPLDQRWQWQGLYLDAAWFTRAEDYQLYGSYSRGIAFKLSSRTPQTLSPYVSATSGHSRNFSDTATGLGLRYRLWFGEDIHNAWRNRIDVRLEINRSIAGDRKGASGWRLQTEWLL